MIEISPENQLKIDAMLSELEKRLTGTRRRAPGTLSTYMDTARRFLSWLGRAPLPSDVDAYFDYRRKNNIGENTLKTEFSRLQKLFLANKLEWTFSKDDTPRITESPFTPTFMPSQVERLIMSQALYTADERFYLAVSTTFGSRREELCRITVKDFDGETIALHIAKQKIPKTIRHLVPLVLQPVFHEFDFPKHGCSGQKVSQIIKKICKKAGVKVGDGWGWHAIRRTLDSMAGLFLPENKLPESLWAEYCGWAKSSTGATFKGSAMAGHYFHPEILSNDPYRLDRMIHPALPTLKMWERALGQVWQVVQPPEIS